MRLLFICGRNQRRSPTAERLFDGVCGVEARSAGTSPDAETALTGELVDWAEIIFVMEAIHRTKLNRNFGKAIRDKRIVKLGIPDVFEFMDAELVQRLWQRVPRSVTVLSAAKPA
jgi:predicted protein tyrosine phosphatase